ncbi:hypothetical protein RM572_22670 [Streptomyces sp. DSM 42041]|uniref:Integral membrane protein n=1 Tax=Streptomyces hazeniae TaxID=3075538 RepID=A0ABU2NX41_9ACTN|nr:hypothetical protein [Streptomyces sp. DSM 42041]MDT0381567.1 hypothetical protein [Streptomyces sp. DSM 42041]
MAPTTPTTRIRLWRWRANPLRRRSDQVEAWVLLLALVAGVVGGALATLVTWGVARGTAEDQRTERLRVSAVVMEDADPQSRETFYKAPGADTSRVPVRWTAPDGTVRSGSAEVPDGSRAGTSVPLWVAPDGSQTAPPAGAAMAALQSGICAALAGGAVVALVCVAQATVRGGLDRRRARQWEREWARVEPQWRPRTP